MIGLGNKDHNPVQKLVQKIEIFLFDNKMDAKGLLNRLDSETSVGIPIKDFSTYCQRKIAKDASMGTLMSQVRLLDIDKDGYISVDDLETSLRNVNIKSFFRDSGAPLQKA